MKHIFDCTKEELSQWLGQNNQQSFRVNQILQWVYEKKVYDWNLMTNLAGPLRELLAQEWQIKTARLREEKVCPDDTVKLLLEWPDAALTETVLLSDDRRRTVCVSSQVGCPVGCKFCASGLEGLQRSLTAGEIVEQVIQTEAFLAEGERISNVVVMGTGEPFANYDAVLKAVRILNAEWGPAIGARHITISTIGLPDEIRRLADEDLQVTLAVSLHAADDELREKLIPWAQKIKIDDIITAVIDYYEKTHREVTFEYVLLERINDSAAEAEKLARLAHRCRCNVNLIRYNEVIETGYRAPKREVCLDFQERLRKLGVNVHLRKSKGADIDAACGQLRNRHLASDRRKRCLKDTEMIKVLQNWDEIGRAVIGLGEMDIPRHGSLEKCWDFEILTGLVADMPRNIDIVDMGCSGLHTLRLLHHLGFQNLYGVDLCPTLLDRAKQLKLMLREKRLTSPFKVKRGDMTRTSFTTGRFDLATCISVLEHGVNRQAFIKEAARILKPGGMLMVTADYWQDRVDMGGIGQEFNLPWTILSREDIESLIRLGQENGLHLKNKMDIPACDQRCIIWQKKRFTFIALVFVRE